MDHVGGERQALHRHLNRTAAAPEFVVAAWVLLAGAELEAEPELELELEPHPARASTRAGGAMSAKYFIGLAYLDLVLH